MHASSGVGESMNSSVVQHMRTGGGLGWEDGQGFADVVCT
jgi:hypothetical protein